MGGGSRWGREEGHWYVDFVDISNYSLRTRMFTKDDPICRQKLSRFYLQLRTNTGV